jgi:hypothetical protein
MKRKGAWDPPQEPLDQHRDMSRRSFLDCAGKAAVGGLTATAILDTVRPQAVSAQQARQGQEGRTMSEPNRFDYLPIIDRPAIKWPNNARLAFWVAPNMEFFELV